MKIPKFPPQINRLLILIYAIVVSYLVARTILTPASFREQGFYRADALIERTDLDRTFAGKVACGESFPEASAVLEKGGHKTLSCEACHGPMDLTALAGKDAKPPKPPEGFCLRCHEASATRPAAFKQIVVKDHYEGKCLECHLAHHPAEMPPDPDDPPDAPAPDAPAPDAPVPDAAAPDAAAPDAAAPTTDPQPSETPQP